MLLSYKFRLQPTKKQRHALASILEGQRQLYNAALQEREDCYRKTGRGRSLYDQCQALTQWRAGDAEAASSPLRLQRWTLCRVDQAYRHFYGRLVRHRSRAGFPRYRGFDLWRTFGFSEFAGIKWDGRRLRFSGVPGGLRVHLHRAMPAGKPTSCSFTRHGDRWTVSFQITVVAAPPTNSVAEVGIDVGLTSLATLSDGTKIPTQRFGRRAMRRFRRRQRALLRCQRASKRRHKVRARLARDHRSIANARSTHLHQVSAGLVKRFDVIAVEKLRVKSLAAGMLAGPIHDASWGRLRDFLAYKAERAGGRLIQVDPRYTSQACSGCGVIVPKPLSQRTHSCDACGLTIDRDHNAALNILGKAVAGLEAVNVIQQDERRPRNIASRESHDARRYPKEGRDQQPSTNLLLWHQRISGNHDP